MSTSAVPIKDEPPSEQDFSEYRLPSDIVITVDTGNSVCSTILVEGCSDDLDLSLNDEEGNHDKSSEMEEQEQIEEAPSRPKRLRTKTVQSPPQDIKPIVGRKTRKARKGRQERSEPPHREERQVQQKLQQKFQQKQQQQQRVLPTANVGKKGLYLRSAVLSRDEITHEVLHRSKADMPKPREASLFTTKLMMRLASRLPPSRARPTCEELKDLMNAQRDRSLGEFPSYRSTGQGTPLRVKAERPSFCETINHIMQVPTEEDAADFRSNMLFNITCSNIHCREEREQKIALLQQQSMQEMEPLVEEVNPNVGLASLSIDSLQQALRDSNCPNRKEIEKQIALHQLETLRGRRGRPSPKDRDRR